MSIHCDFQGCHHVFELRKIHDKDCTYDGMFKGCGCFAVEDYIFHQHCNVEGCNITTFHKHPSATKLSGATFQDVLQRLQKIEKHLASHDISYEDNKQ